RAGAYAGALGDMRQRRGFITPLAKDQRRSVEDLALAFGRTALPARRRGSLLGLGWSGHGVTELIIQRNYCKCGDQAELAVTISLHLTDHGISGLFASQDSDG